MRLTKEKRNAMQAYLRAAVRYASTPNAETKLDFDLACRREQELQITEAEQRAFGRELGFAS